MLGHEVGVLVQRVARPFDLEDGRVMHKPVEQRGRCNRTPDALMMPSSLIASCVGRERGAPRLSRA